MRGEPYWAKAAAWRGQSLMATQEYPASARRWNHGVVDILTTDDDGVDHFDYTRFHDIEPLS